MKTLEVQSALRIGNLRAMADSLITQTWVALNRNNEATVKSNTKNYNELRVTMSQEGIASDDIHEYDEQFINLPWRDFGYPSPELEVIE